ncbi:MAG: hypothetical protein M3X11_08685 [Acidobacteriota bacterium]|nr:hypothetical protein [Acidobacteriota bacterium]
MRSIRYPLNITIVILLLVSLIPPTPTAGQGQDLTFRLMNIERRLDQMQTRIDYVERVQQSPTPNIQSSNMATAAVLELQRQQLYLAEQVLMMQRQMLEMQKKFDRLMPTIIQPPPPTAIPVPQEKKEKPEEKPRPKPTTKP